MAVSATENALREGQDYSNGNIEMSQFSSRMTLAAVGWTGPTAMAMCHLAPRADDTEGLAQPPSAGSYSELPWI